MAARAYLVQTAANVNWGRLDHIVHDVGQWCQKVGGVDFRIEENFRSKEPFISDINGVLLLDRFNQRR